MLSEVDYFGRTLMITVLLDQARLHVDLRILVEHWFVEHDQVFALFGCFSLHHQLVLSLKKELSKGGRIMWAWKDALNHSKFAIWKPTLLLSMLEAIDLVVEAAICLRKINYFRRRLGSWVI